jgi:hypothetical protein
MIRRPWLLCVVLGLSGVACHKAPPPPAPRPAVIPAPKKPAKPPVLEPPPATEVAKPLPVPDEKQPPLPTVVQAEPEPPPAPAPKPTQRKTKPVAKPKPAPAAAEPPVAPQTAPPAVIPEPAAEAPKLGEVMSEQQRQETLQSYEASRAEARQALEQLSKRKLNREQLDTMARSQNFLAQAERLLPEDLRTAAQLARRAALLAGDLLKELQ